MAEINIKSKISDDTPNISQHPVAATPVALDDSEFPNSYVSIIQSLYCLPEIGRSLLQLNFECRAEELAKSTIYQLQKAFLSWMIMTTKEGGGCRVADFLTILPTIEDLNEYEDRQFRTHLISAIDEKLAPCSKLKTLFGGLLEQYRECRKCGNRKSIGGFQTDAFRLNIYDQRGRTKSIDEALANFLAPRPDPRTQCSSCKGFHAISGRIVKEWPYFLIIDIDRVSFEKSTLGASVFDDSIDFDDAWTIKCSKNGKVAYELLSVVVLFRHAAASAYRVCFKNGWTKRWNIIDDRGVRTEINFENVKKFNGGPNGSFVSFLIYRKVDPSKNESMPKLDELPERIRKMMVDQETST